MNVFFLFSGFRTFSVTGTLKMLFNSLKANVGDETVAE